MMEFIPGAIDLEDSADERDVWNYLQERFANVEGLCGYRWPTVGMASLQEVPSFVIVAKPYGIILVDVVDDRIVETSADGDRWRMATQSEWVLSRDVVLSSFANEVTNRLSKNSKLYNRRQKSLLVPISTVLILCRNPPADVGSVLCAEDIVAPIVDKTHLREQFESLTQTWPHFDLDLGMLDLMVADLESTRVLQADPQMPSGFPDDARRMSTFMRKSLDHTLKLDSVQRKISIQLPDGPQRIRGLAGTGKTVVLSLKAALAHKNFPGFKILFLFNTLSMYRQVTDWVQRYYAAEARKPLNPENLHIYHAWGGIQQGGLYYNTAIEYGLKPLTYHDVRMARDPLETVYGRLLEATRGRLIPKYDMVLIDEAQDFAPAVFETIFHLTRDPKRIIWAYDEFQSMKDMHMLEPEQLFGLDPSGQPNVPNSSLQGTYFGGVEKDFALKNSYRNPRLNLMLAHGTALGLYRSDGIIDMIGGRSSWEAIGYQFIEPDEGSLRSGQSVQIERPMEFSRNKLEILLREQGQDDRQLVATKQFNQLLDEVNFVVQEISHLITKENVQPEDVFVIALDSRTSAQTLMDIRQGLDVNGVKAITPGYVEKPSQFKVPGFVTLTTPFRAKGNEADFVFVLNSQRVIEDKTFHARNALFVAITRSRGWTYVTGVGDSTGILNQEIEQIKLNYPKFRFTYPAKSEIARHRVIIAANDRLTEKAQEDAIRMTEDPLAFAVLVETLKSNPKRLKYLARLNDSLSEVDARDDDR